MAVFTISRFHVLLFGLLFTPFTAAVGTPCPTITRTAIQPYCPSSTEGCFFPQIIELKTVTVPCGCPRVPATSTSYLPCPTQDCFFITPTQWSTEYATCTPSKRSPTTTAPPCTCPPGVLCNCLLPTPTPTPTPPPKPDPKPAVDTCTTVTTTGGTACPPLDDCITLACVDIETATLSCGCDQIHYSTTCATACPGGCGATQWDTFALPCPTSPPGISAY